MLFHLGNIRIYAASQNVLSVLRDYGLTLINKKYEFSRSLITFMGHIIDERGISIESQKVKAERCLNRKTHGLAVHHRKG